MPSRHPVPSDPNPRLVQAEARVGALADSGRETLSVEDDMHAHVTNCRSCQPGGPCPELGGLLNGKDAAPARLRHALQRLTGVRSAKDGTFTVSHEGEQLADMCELCLAVIAGQGLRLLPEEQQRVVMAATAEGRRLIRAARAVAGPAAGGGTIPAEAMDELVYTTGRFPTGRQLRNNLLARAIRHGA